MRIIWHVYIVLYFYNLCVENKNDKKYRKFMFEYKIIVYTYFK